MISEKLLNLQVLPKIKTKMAEENAGIIVGRRDSWLKRVWRFYVEGFKGMTIGRTLWAVILIKLFVMFFILKLFFFPNLLNTNYDTDAERAEAVRTNLTK